MLFLFYFQPLTCHVEVKGERNSDVLSILFKTRAAVLFQHIKVKPTAECFRYKTARTTIVSSDFKNDQCYELIGDEILNMNAAIKILNISNVRRQKTSGTLAGSFF